MHLFLEVSVICYSSYSLAPNGKKPSNSLLASWGLIEFHQTHMNFNFSPTPPGFCLQEMWLLGNRGQKRDRCPEPCCGRLNKFVFRLFICCALLKATLIGEKVEMKGNVKIFAILTLAEDPRFDIHHSIVLTIFFLPFSFP